MKNRDSLRVDFLWVCEQAQEEKKVGVENRQLSLSLCSFVLELSRGVWGLDMGGKVTPPSQTQGALETAGYNDTPC